MIKHIGHYDGLQLTGGYCTFYCYQTYCMKQWNSFLIYLTPPSLPECNSLYDISPWCLIVSCTRKRTVRRRGDADCLAADTHNLTLNWICFMLICNDNYNQPYFISTVSATKETQSLWFSGYKMWRRQAE